MGAMTNTQSSQILVCSETVFCSLITSQSSGACLAV